MNIYEQLEEGLLTAADVLSEQAKEQGTKALMDMFKSLVLKKYKDAFEEEQIRGQIYRKTIDKFVDFIYSDLCVSIRTHTKWSDDYKEQQIQLGKTLLPSFKETMYSILQNRGVVLI